MTSAEQHETWMRRAIEVGASVHGTTSPNPAVGCIIVTRFGQIFEGATEQPGGRHAEIVALEFAGRQARGATLVTTLEPCSHQGRTGPCTNAIIEADIEHVVIGVRDPDTHVNGRGIEQLRDAGIAVTENVAGEAISQRLRHYLTHRRTGRPFVTLKSASTLDGKIAAADGTSKWITGTPARVDAHALRAAHDAIVVGAGTVRADNPSLTVRHVTGRDPQRVVLGRAPKDAAIHPCWELCGDIEEVLCELGRRGILSLLVEGGANVAGQFHAAGLVDEYVAYLAPSIMGDIGTTGLFAGVTTTTIEQMFRCVISDVQRLGDDIKIVMHPTSPPL